MSAKYTIVVNYDPAGVSWLGQDPKLTPKERATAFEKIESEEWEIYEVSLIEDCPRHGWKCEQAIERGNEGYILAENGHHGTYGSPGEIREEALQGLAYGMWAAVQA